ncbi:MAG: hypothetical protein MJ177_10245 [Clostridia bacterium]|nr:hypothetical protein [Clostridia bacterium]
MDNNPKISKEQLEALLKKVSSSGEPKTDINEFAEKNLTPEQNRALSKALQNPELIKTLLASPQAKAFMKKILGDN